MCLAMIIAPAVDFCCRVVGWIFVGGGVSVISLPSFWKMRDSLDFVGGFLCCGAFSRSTLLCLCTIFGIYVLITGTRESIMRIDH